MINAIPELSRRRLLCSATATLRWSPPPLLVFEGQSHAQFLEPFAPETQEAFREIGSFLDTYLAA